MLRWVLKGTAVQSEVKFSWKWWATIDGLYSNDIFVTLVEDIENNHYVSALNVMKVFIGVPFTSPVMRCTGRLSQFDHRRWILGKPQAVSAKIFKRNRTYNILGDEVVGWWKYNVGLQRLIVLKFLGVAFVTQHIMQRNKSQCNVTSLPVVLRRNSKIKAGKRAMSASAHM